MVFMYCCVCQEEITKILICIFQTFFFLQQQSTNEKWKMYVFCNVKVDVDSVILSFIILAILAYFSSSFKIL